MDVWITGVICEGIEVAVGDRYSIRGKIERVNLLYLERGRIAVELEEHGTGLRRRETLESFVLGIQARRGAPVGA